MEKDERDTKRAEIDRRNKARKPGTQPSVPLDQYAGEYRDAAYGTGKVTADGGKLVWEWSSFRCPLEHFQDDVFRVTDGYFEDQLVEFARGEWPAVAAADDGGGVRAEVSRRSRPPELVRRGQYWGDGRVPGREAALRRRSLRSRRSTTPG